MTTHRSIALGILLTALFSVSAIAQAGAAQVPAPGRIYIINPNMFADEKAGITKFVAALTTLNKEFAKDQADLKTLADKIQRLADELKVLQQQINDGKVPVNKEAAQAKADEYDRLQREFKFKQDDAKARYDKREAEIMGPITAEIGKGVQEFSKKNGYWMIMDASKLDSVLSFDDNADVTKAFITFYNARP